MTHRGYAATLIELNDESGTISGEVALARGATTFEGRTVAEAAQAFRDSVDDYLAICAEHGIEPAGFSDAEVAARSAG